MSIDKTIKLTKYADVIAEYTATAVAILPGKLLELTSSGTVQVHSSAGGNAIAMFALENELEGKGVDTNIAASGKVQCWFPGRGDIVNAVVADGSAAIVIGDFLESNGAGYLQKHVADVESFESAEAGSITVLPAQIVGVALEAVDVSDSSGAESSGSLGYDKRIRVRLI